MFSNNPFYVGVLSESAVVFQVLLVDHQDRIVGSGVVLDEHVILTTAQHFQTYSYSVLFTFK